MSRRHAKSTRSRCLDCDRTFEAAGTADLHGMTAGHSIAMSSDARCVAKPEPDVSAETGRSRSPRPCAGWEDDESPEPTCWPHGCQLLDDQGECPGWMPPHE